MKATALLSIALCAAFGAAQNLDDISECGRMCINNMLNKASELGCDSTDKACLCSKQNFAFGLRDCTLQACGAEDLPKIIAWTASGTASDTATGTPTGTPTGTDGPDSTPSETASSQTTPAEGAAGRVMTTAAPGVAGALGLIALLAM
ncbi:chitinase 3 [Coccidioides immitis RMSCC 3703]|uniref:Chitinase 3 n=1 Tax=Coccidioides immitis RMSCC 3703 TaxID=454286 RepID=A0A0J8U3H6_COCIT|nr:chitinase 3 [Coccidioides immitis RMSCC 3703]